MNESKTIPKIIFFVSHFDLRLKTERKKEKKYENLSLTVSVQNFAEKIIIYDF